VYNVYNYPTMYWRTLADGTFQKMTSLRVYPWPRVMKKSVTVTKCPNEELTKKLANHKLMMDSLKKGRQ